MLHIKGYFPGQPMRINFEVWYQAVAGRWRVFGLSVQTVNSTGVTGDTNTSPNKK